MLHPISSFPIQRIRQDFPILHQQIHGKPLIYLDNAASVQQPRRVVEAMMEYVYQHHSNVHRGVHTLSQRATAMLEAARARVQQFVGASSSQQVVFTKGSTEALNLIAFGWGLRHLRAGDEILLTELEHHANIVPWQEVAAQTGASLRYIPASPQDGQLDLSQLDHLLTPRTKLLSLAHASNVTGELLPVATLIQKAREVGAIVVLDGAQSVPHLPVDVDALDCDFFVFSGHKMCGPTGIGALIGKAQRLEEMGPYSFGGAMIESVGWETSRYLPPPHRFEAGTPPIAAAIGLAAAMDYLDEIGMTEIATHEEALTQYALSRLATLDDCRCLGSQTHRVGVLSLVFDRGAHPLHPFDIGQLLDAEGIAVRTGNHCAQPLMTRLGVAGTVRASVALYNTFDEIDAFIDALEQTLLLLA